jgi:uncharacterized protein
MTRVAVTGATGTIGRALCAALIERGDEVVALTRDPQRAHSVLTDGVQARVWRNPAEEVAPVEALTGVGAVVNLLGERLDQRWTDQAKVKIRDSRVLGTRMLVQALEQLPGDRRPSILVSQSAAGFYGPSDDRELDESAPAGRDFLAGVVSAWEAEATAAEPMMRVVRTRTGVVLSSEGGALARMLPFFRAGIGGPVAGGRQYVPWIHLDDVVAGLVFAIQEPAVAGAANLAAPNPVTNAELSHALGRALHRPAALPVPSLALRVLYGAAARPQTPAADGVRVPPPPDRTRAEGRALAHVTAILWLGRARFDRLPPRWIRTYRGHACLERRWSGHEKVTLSSRHAT